MSCKRDILNFHFKIITSTLTLTENSTPCFISPLSFSSCSAAFPVARHSSLFRVILGCMIQTLTCGGARVITRARIALSPVQRVRTNGQPLISTSLDCCVRRGGQSSVCDRKSRLCVLGFRNRATVISERVMRKPGSGDCISCNYWIMGFSSKSFRVCVSELPALSWLQPPTEKWTLKGAPVWLKLRFAALWWWVCVCICVHVAFLWLIVCFFMCLWCVTS